MSGVDLDQHRQHGLRLARGRAELRHLQRRIDADADPRLARQRRQASRLGLAHDHVAHQHVARSRRERRPRPRPPSGSTARPRPQRPGDARSPGTCAPCRAHGARPPRSATKRCTAPHVRLEGVEVEQQRRRVDRVERIAWRSRCRRHRHSSITSAPLGATKRKVSGGTTALRSMARNVKTRGAAEGVAHLHRLGQTAAEADPDVVEARIGALGLRVEPVEARRTRRRRSA